MIALILLIASYAFVIGVLVAGVAVAREWNREARAVERTLALAKRQADDRERGNRLHEAEQFIRRIPAAW